MTAYLLQHALLGDGEVARPIVRGGGSRTASSRAARRAAGARPRSLPGPHPPRSRQLPQPRVPPGAARAHPAGARVVLDLARADVRRRRPTSPRHLLRAGPRHLRRDARHRASPRSASSTTCTTSPTARRTTTPTRWARRCSPPADDAGIRIRAARHLLPRRRLRPGRPRACRCATPTATRTPGPSGSRPSTTSRASARRSTRCAPCPRDQLPVVVEAAAGRPLHVHLSEQVAENDACLAATGLTPTQLLAEAGALGPLTTAVHATHLTDDDIALLGESRTHVCFCPTTERDLADGIGPARRLHDAGAVLTLGSDSHAVIDLFEEMRAVEMHERLATQQRGHWSAAELLAAATYDGHALARLRRRRPDRRRAARRPGHRRPRHDPHPRHRRHRRDPRLRRHRRRRPGGRIEPRRRREAVAALDAPRRRRGAR